MQSSFNKEQQQKIPSATLQLMLQRQQAIQQQERLTALALASRNQSLVLHRQRIQEQQQELLMKHAAFERAAAEDIRQLRALPLQVTGSQYRNQFWDQQQVDRSRPRSSSPMLCAESDLSIHKDICFGRGQRVQRREANVAFRKIVAEYQEIYDHAESRERKKEVVLQVANIFEKKGFRFFKERDEDSPTKKKQKIWVAVPSSHVEYKIAHSFRSGRKILKREQERERRKTELKKRKLANGGCSDSSRIHNDGHANEIIVRESDLTVRDICLGENRAQCTTSGACNYEHFRDFIGTFKSLFKTSGSLGEKTTIVLSLVQQMHEQIGCRFLVPMSLRSLHERFDTSSEVEAKGWAKAPIEKVYEEVLSILTDGRTETGETKKEHIPSETVTKLFEQKRSSDAESEVANGYIRQAISIASGHPSKVTPPDSTSSIEKLISELPSSISNTSKMFQNIAVQRQLSASTNIREALLRNSKRTPSSDVEAGLPLRKQLQGGSVPVSLFESLARAKLEKDLLDTAPSRGNLSLLSGMGGVLGNAMNGPSANIEPELLKHVQDQKRKELEMKHLLAMLQLQYPSF